MNGLTADTFSWWQTTLSSLLPSRRGDGAPTIVVSSTDPDEVDRQLAAIDTNQSRSQVDVELSGGATHVWRSLLNANVRRGIRDQLIQNDLRTATPFQPDDVVTLAISERGVTGYAIVRRPFWGQLTARIGQAGLSLGRVHIDTPTHGRLALQPPRLSLKPRIRWAAAALFMITLCATAGHVFVREVHAIQVLRADIAALEPRVANVRQMMRERRVRQQQLHTVSKRRAETPYVTQVWEDLSRALPDSAYLTDFAMDENGLQIAGFTSEPSSVVPALQGSAAFTDVRLASPMVRIPGRSTHRFSIAAQILQ